MPEKKKIPEPMHTVWLALVTSQDDRKFFNRCFHAVSHLHNVMVKHARKLIIQLEHDHSYQEILSEYRAFNKAHKKDEKLSKEDSAYKKMLSEQLKAIRTEIGLSKGGFEKYLRVCGKRYGRLLSSQQVQKEAARVWKSVSDVIFGKGKAVHFKKFRDFDTISGKSNKNGIRFDRDNFTITFMGETYNVMRPDTDDMAYIYEALGLVNYPAP